MKAKLTWAPAAWDEYIYWQSQDKKTLKRINRLIQDIMHEPTSLVGLGEPELLKYDLSGCISRRIDAANRLVYVAHGDSVLIISCRGHYD